MTDIERAAKTVATSLEMYPDPFKRVGMRSGMMDAAHLCDAIARDVVASRRPSKERDAICAAIERCGNAIKEMRNLVTVS